MIQGEPQGYIFIWRKIMQSPIWQKKPYSHGQAWIDMLLRASYKERAIPRPAEVGSTKLQPGEFIHSKRKLAIEYGWSRGKLNRFIRWLKSDTMISTTDNGNYTRFKVLNWSEYQNGGTTHDTTDEPPAVPPTDHRRTTDGPHTIHYKKDKESKEGEEAVPFNWASGSVDAELFNDAIKTAKLVGKHDTIRNYISGWKERVGGAEKLKELFWSGKVNGFDVIEVQDYIKANHTAGKSTLHEEMLSRFMEEPDE